jgi:glucosamine--fructose-6-phosphate aminotransferase (isomerizing)
MPSKGEMMERGQFTYHEILSQPYSWAAALEILRLERPRIESVWNKDFTQLLFTGCGSTYYLALSAAAMAQELTGVPARGLPASELWLNPRVCYPRNGRNLLIAISRSGETTETLRACQVFKDDQSGKLVTISCYPDMPLAEMGHLNLVLPSGQEQSVAQTRAFSTLYLACAGLASFWTGSGLEKFSGLIDAGVKLLGFIGGIVKPLGQDNAIDRFYFLGSGSRYGLASEISLKMKEMSLSHSEPFHFLEFRHGPMSMVCPSSLVVGLLSESNRTVEAQVLEDVRALGGRTLSIGEEAADVEFASGLLDIFYSVLYLPVGQLLAFERSLAKNLNPDRPNNLESVVKLP